MFRSRNESPAESTDTVTDAWWGGVSALSANLDILLVFVKVHLFFGIRQHLVSLLDRCHLILALQTAIRILIGVPLECELPIRFFHLLGVRVAGHREDLVVILSLELQRVYLICARVVLFTCGKYIQI